MFLIAGLGNPGVKYENTYHNIGFKCADYFMQRHNFERAKKRFEGEISEAKVFGQKVFVLKPHTFMNRSGQSVYAAMDYYNISPENLIVVLDDIDLGVGEVRARPKGSAGTHNGLRDIISQLGTTEFKRVRIGIGPKPMNYDLADYVLSNIIASQGEKLNQAIITAVDEIEKFITN